MNKSVLISGAGIGGPSLAYWLSRYGYNVTVVEKSQSLRASGSAVDFRGDHMALLEKMGILDAVKALETGMGEETIVDAAGRKQAALPSAMFSGEVEIDRGDLATILYELSKNDKVEYVFGDHITALVEKSDCVEVTFNSGATRTFDFVVGADGLHSAVRRLTFGDENQFRNDLGYYAAGFSMPNVFGLDHNGLIYNEPDRFVSVSSGRNPEVAFASFVFAESNQHYDRYDIEQQKSIVAQHFPSGQWQLPVILKALQETPTLYFDTLSQIRLETWSRGRVTLLGDAAWCAGPGGIGTGYAMLGAYTLAGELASAGDDYHAAFAEYEKIMRVHVDKSQKFASNVGSSLAPKTERKIRSRNRIYRILSSSVMTKVFTWLSTKTAKSGELKDYSGNEQHPSLVRVHA